MDNVDSPVFTTAVVIVAAAFIFIGLINVFWLRNVVHLDNLFF